MLSFLEETLARQVRRALGAKTLCSSKHFVGCLLFLEETLARRSFCWMLSLRCAIASALPPLVVSEAVSLKNSVNLLAASSHTPAPMTENPGLVVVEVDIRAVQRDPPFTVLPLCLTCIWVTLVFDMHLGLQPFHRFNGG